MKTHLTPQEWGLLIGQEVMTPDGKAIVDTVSSIYMAAEFGAMGPDFVELYEFGDGFNCKPILRRMESMTEGEAKELDVVYEYMGGYLPRPPEAIRMISAGFDILGWIDQGLAVDRDTLGKEVEK